MYDESDQRLTGLMMGALLRLSVRPIDMPLTPERIWNAMASFGNTGAHVEYFGRV